MKLVIYRDRATNKITSSHEVTKACTEELICNYNSNSNNPYYVQIVELDDVAEYFYTGHKARIEDEAENLRDLEETLRDIANRIDDRLYDFDRWFSEEKDK